MKHSNYNNRSYIGKRHKLNRNNCYLQPTAMRQSMSPSPLCLSPLNEHEMSCNMPSLSLSDDWYVIINKAIDRNKSRNVNKSIYVWL